MNYDSNAALAKQTEAFHASTNAAGYAQNISRPDKNDISFTDQLMARQEKLIFLLSETGADLNMLFDRTFVGPISPTSTGSAGGQGAGPPMGRAEVILGQLDRAIAQADSNLAIARSLSARV